MADPRAHDRLAELREEERKGREALAELERRSRELRDQLLRISGAIQVLEELEQEAPDAERPED